MSTSPLVSLREITAQTVRAVTDLSVADEQQRFVASNAVSLAEALFTKEAWYRAIYSGEQLAGFVMLYDEALRSHVPESPQVAIWRFMIDRSFQGRGVGRAAIQLVIEHVKSKGLYKKLDLSYVPGPGCPEPLYRSLGFKATGKEDQGELGMELVLRPDAN